MFELNAWEWVLLAFGSLLVGLSKTGIAGLGIFTVAIFASVLPARESTGVVLLLLLCGDLIAVPLYRRHAVWSHLWKLFPWVAAGVLMGFFAMGRLQGDKAFQRMIGVILLGMVAVHVWRQWRLSRDSERANGDVPHRLWFAALMGSMAGFTTMVANAAGPVMILYMLSMRLPKMEFLGTGAWFFLAVNLFKVPFSYRLDLITAASLTLDLKLAPLAVIGAVFGRLLIGHINQSLFETLALALTVLAAARMLF
jgi:uncharacterized membrane protein YfcA